MILKKHTYVSNNKRADLFFPNNLPRCGIEGIDSGVDTELGDAAGQDSGGVQMGEGGGGGGIGQIVSGHVDGLDRGDGTLLGGGDSLLHGTHVSGQGGLVTDSGGDTTEQGRHLGTGLGEAENVVNEEEHILTLGVTEVLGDGQTGQGDTGTGAWGLVHLTVHKGDLEWRRKNGINSFDKFEFIY